MFTNVILRELVTEESHIFFSTFFILNKKFFTSQHPQSHPSFRMTFIQQIAEQLILFLLMQIF